MTPPSPRVRRALVSVADKTGVVEVARQLTALGVAIVSTGGTARTLRDGGVDLEDVSDVTGFPELMDGRVKTLHPRIHGAILARRDNTADQTALEDHHIDPIDLVVVNLYPFQRTVAAGAPFDDCIEQIDIGGPAIIRAAAKNHEHVAVVTAPTDYSELLAELKEHDGSTTLAFRRKMAASAFTCTAAYDGAIAQWFSRQAGEAIPDVLIVRANLKQRLRYGENPHQEAGLYTTSDHEPGICNASQIQGKALSYNNLADADAAWELVNEFARPAAAIIKHANPCGVAEQQSLSDAYARARRCDPESAYGGIIAVNRNIDGTTAHAITEVFTEVVIAPGVDDDAREVLARKTNLRVLIAARPVLGSSQIRSLSGGVLMQRPDYQKTNAGDLLVMTQRSPTDDEHKDLLFAFTVCKHVKSNAIVYAKNGATVAVGAGQMSRVDSARIAAWKAADAAKKAGEKEPRTVGSVVASDAFFPFADGLLAAIEAGATAVIQPGGSKRDQEVIDAANANGIAMVFTGVRHFRH